MMERALNKFIRILSFIAVGWLFLLSLFGSTAFQVTNPDNRTDLKDWKVDTYLIGDSWWRHIIVIAAVALAAALAVRKLQGRQAGKGATGTKTAAAGISVRRRRLLLYSIYGVIGLFLILGMQLQPVSDPAKLMRIADELLAGDVSSFAAPDSYMYRYPFQNGMVLLDALLLALFHGKAFLVFQVLNLAASVWIAEGLTRIAEKIFPELRLRGSVAVPSIILFGTPILCYTTYNYGTLLSLAMMCGAIVLEIQYLEDRRIERMAAAAVLAGFGIEIKTNSLILLVAMVLYLLFDMVRRPGKKAVVRDLAGIVLIVVLFTAVRAAVNYSTERMTGLPTSPGMPKICWAAMGITGDGRYNGLNLQLFEESGYDTARASEAARDSIRKTLQGYREHPGQFLRWLGRKTAFEWNAPDFGGLNTNRNRGQYAIISGFFYELFYGYGYSALWSWFNQLQSLLYLGVLLYLAAGDHSRWNHTLLLTVFLGGFWFHTVWEGGPQYTLPYYLVLAPCAAAGYCTAAHIVSRTAMTTGTFKTVRRLRVLAGALAVILAMIVLSRDSALTSRIVTVKDPQEVLDVYEHYEHERNGNG